MLTDPSEVHRDQLAPNQKFRDSESVKRTVQFRIFKSSINSWEKLFSDAADFANQLPPEALINISHSADNHQGVVTVWFWNRNVI